MLTGAVPFPRESEVAIMRAHLSAQPPSARALVPSLRAELDAVIARAMAKDPDSRYPSAGDLGRDALAASEGQRAPVVERSVANGRAAPLGPSETTIADGPSTTGGAAARPTRSRLTTIVGLARAAGILIALPPRWL